RAGLAGVGVRRSGWRASARAGRRVRRSLGSLLCGRPPRGVWDREDSPCAPCRMRAIGAAAGGRRGARPPRLTPRAGGSMLARPMAPAPDDPLVLAVDLGTSGVRVALVDAAGAVLGAATRALDVRLGDD